LNIFGSFSASLSAGIQYQMRLIEQAGGITVSQNSLILHFCDVVFFTFGQLFSSLLLIADAF